MTREVYTGSDGRNYLVLRQDDVIRMDHIDGSTSSISTPHYYLDDGTELSELIDGSLQHPRTAVVLKKP